MQGRANDALGPVANRTGLGWELAELAASFDQNVTPNANLDTFVPDTTPTELWHETSRNKEPSAELAVCASLEAVRS